MYIALQKTITLLLLIGIGFLFRSKLRSKEQINGIKDIVLTLALPATIFIALLKIEVNSTLIAVPFITLLFNFLLFYIVPLSFPLLQVEKQSATGRTLQMLVPSLAPGLSCFPFIAEFLGEKSLAVAALADVGNKFFVLIFLYIIAMNFFLKNNADEKSNTVAKIKGLMISMVKEPINLLILLAVILLTAGINYTSLPLVITDLFNKTSALMTPLVLIFIGLAVQLKEGRKKLVISILFLRAGISLLISAGMIYLFSLNEPSTILLAVVVPLSSASFWPLAHISAFNNKEDQKGFSKEKRTFDLELAILILAFSLPFSTILILGILTAGSFFAANITLILVTGIILIIIGIFPFLIAHQITKVSNA